MKITEEQFDRAHGVMCAYEDDRGFSRADLLAAIALMLGGTLPESVDLKSAVELLRDSASPTDENDVLLRDALRHATGSLTA